MTVLFFSLYFACIWSIVGITFCAFVGFVVFKHLLAANAGLRDRGKRGSEREQAVLVQDSSARVPSGRHGAIADIAGCGLGGATGSIDEIFGGGVMNQWTESPRDLAALG